MDIQKRQEIKHLYHDERLTQKEISYRLQISQQTVSRILKEESKKEPQKALPKKGGVVSKDLKNLSLWRYHALHFIIHPYWFFPRYQKIRQERGNVYITNHDWKYRLNEKTIEVMLRRGFDFLDQDKFEAINKAENSLNRTLYEISNSCGFEFEKEGRISIKCVKQHLARTNSSIAKGLKKDYIQVKGIDGKVWFLIDRSKGLLEHEYVHPGTMMEDSENIEGFFDDLKAHPELSLSRLNEDQRLTRTAVKELTIQIKLHLEVMSEMKDTLKAIRESLKK